MTDEQYRDGLDDEIDALAAELQRRADARPFWDTVARLYREYGMEDETMAEPTDGTTFTREDGSTGVWQNGLPRTTVTDNSMLTEAIDRTHADAFSALHTFMNAIVAYEAATGTSPLDGTQYGRVFAQDMESALFAFADIIAERYDESR